MQAKYVSKLAHIPAVNSCSQALSIYISGQSYWQSRLGSPYYRFVIQLPPSRISHGNFAVERTKSKSAHSWHEFNRHTGVIWSSQQDWQPNSSQGFYPGKAFKHSHRQRSDLIVSEYPAQAHVGSEWSLVQLLHSWYKHAWHKKTAFVSLCVKDDIWTWSPKDWIYKEIFIVVPARYLFFFQVHDLQHAQSSSQITLLPKICTLWEGVAVWGVAVSRDLKHAHASFAWLLNQLGPE